MASLLVYRQACFVAVFAVLESSDGYSSRHFHISYEAINVEAEAKIPATPRSTLASGTVLDLGQAWLSAQSIDKPDAEAPETSNVTMAVPSPAVKEAKKSWLESWLADILARPASNPEAGRGDTAADWCLLAGTVVVLVLFDALVLAKFTYESSSLAKLQGSGSLWTHAVVLLFWVFVAVVYNGVIYWQKGADAATQWCAGYALEWLLSLDNLFVFHLVFRAYSTPRVLLQKALFIGILGAVICRMGFFAIIGSLMGIFHWMRLVFGLVLIYSGIQAARGDEDEDEDVAENFFVRCFRHVCGSRLRSEYDPHGRLIVWSETSGRCEMTLLVPVIVCLVAVDLLFALDSVSAKVAQIPSLYLAYSSSVIALFGMRSMFFIIQRLVDWFELLKYGLCAILVFIGLELILEPVVNLPASALLVVIFSVFIVSIAGSAARHRWKNVDAVEGEQPSVDKACDPPGSGC